MANLFFDTFGVSNKLFKGPGVISGVLRIDNVPAQRRIILIDQLTGKTVKQTFSDKNGNYSFTNLSIQRLFTMVGIDDEGVKNADVISNRQAVVP